MVLTIHIRACKKEIATVIIEANPNEFNKPSFMIHASQIAAAITRNKDCYFSIYADGRFIARCENVFVNENDKD